MARKIIITGATSMIGTSLTEVAVRENYEVYTIIRPNTSRKDRLINSPLVHVVYGDLDNLNNIKSLPMDCEVFYHLAWAGTSKDERFNPCLQASNVMYILDAVRLAYRCGVKRFVGAGSQAEYGPVNGIIDDNTKFAPIIPYGAAKLAAGVLSKRLCENFGIQHVWGRICSVYGPHDNDGTMIQYALKCFDNNEIPCFSAATQKWNYLYEDDAGQMFWRLGNLNVPEGAYLIANDESRPLKDYINAIILAYGHGVGAKFDQQGDGNSYGLDVDISKTIQTIHYRPRIKFDEGIRRILFERDIYKGNGDALTEQ